MRHSHQRTFHHHALVLVALASCVIAGCASIGKGGATIHRIAGPAGTLVVDDGGRGGVPIVFAHSYAGSKTHWSAQLAHLRKSRRAIAFDLRGHGDSSPPADNV